MATPVKSNYDTLVQQLTTKIESSLLDKVSNTIKDELAGSIVATVTASINTSLSQLISTTINPIVATIVKNAISTELRPLKERVAQLEKKEANRLEIQQVELQSLAAQLEEVKQQRQLRKSTLSARSQVEKPNVVTTTGKPNNSPAKLICGTGADVEIGRNYHLVARKIPNLKHFDETWLTERLSDSLPENAKIINVQRLQSDDPERLRRSQTKTFHMVIQYAGDVRDLYQPSIYPKNMDVKRYHFAARRKYVKQT